MGPETVLEWVKRRWWKFWRRSHTVWEGSLSCFSRLVYITWVGLGEHSVSRVRSSGQAAKLGGRYSYVRPSNTTNVGSKLPVGCGLWPRHCSKRPNLAAKMVQKWATTSKVTKRTKSGARPQDVWLMPTIRSYEECADATF